MKRKDVVDAVRCDHCDGYVPRREWRAHKEGHPSIVQPVEGQAYANVPIELLEAHLELQRVRATFPGMPYLGSLSSLRIIDDSPSKVLRALSAFLKDCSDESERERKELTSLKQDLDGFRRILGVSE